VAFPLILLRLENKKLSITSELEVGKSGTHEEAGADSRKDNICRGKCLLYRIGKN